MKFLLLVLSLSFCTLTRAANSTTTITCLSCQGGFESSTPCSNILPAGMSGVCTGVNAQCYESVQFFQPGHPLKLVMRDCWVPSDGYTNYCDRAKDKKYNPVGEVAYCRTCTTNNCNNKRIINTRTCAQKAQNPFSLVDVQS